MSIITTIFDKNTNTGEVMDNETREQIALIRYKLISPVLAEPGRVQNEYFRAQEAKQIEEGIDRAARGVVDWVQHGTAYCMNQYNG